MHWWCWCCRSDQKVAMASPFSSKQVSTWGTSFRLVYQILQPATVIWEKKKSIVIQMNFKHPRIRPTLLNFARKGICSNDILGNVQMTFQGMFKWNFRERSNDILGVREGAAREPRNNFTPLLEGKLRNSKVSNIDSLSWRENGRVPLQAMHSNFRSAQ